ncbi:MAG: thioester reductase domain-containing protein [Burkholderiales bacterium]|nr:thioester reductase domain-containing protein [Burkholderiales bacterium]
MSIGTHRAITGWLRSDVIVEPLIHHWYAWSYLIPPAPAARYVTEAQIATMRSFVDAPDVHIAALRDPAMRGGPFIQYDASRVDEVRDLLRQTLHDRQATIALSDAITALERLLAAHPAGDALDPLYARIPAPLRGFVELVYDGRNHPQIRYLEGLLYRSAHYRPDHQAIGLRRLPDSDRRAFVMSTPRLDADLDVCIARPFAERALDRLFEARHAPQPIDDLADRLALDDAGRAAFAALFTDIRPPVPERYRGDAVRVRYFGHACVLIETASTAVLVDPLVSYPHADGLARYSYDDLPPFIDHVLITHNHQDHVMFETLLQLRHRIGQVIVPRSHKGSLLDPSLRSILLQIGFGDVREVDVLESIALPDGEIVAIPVLGEHGDLDIAAKTAYWIELQGRSVLCAADSNNLDTALYDHVRHLLGPLDVLFIGMECDGAPYTWAYGPLLPAPVPHRQAQSRRLNGSDATRAATLVDRLEPQQVCVYAMGQEPWLEYITSIHYTPASAPIVESDQFVRRCQDRGIPAERLLGRAEIRLQRRASRRPAPTPIAVDTFTATAVPPAPAPVTAPPPRPAADESSTDALGALLDALHRLGVRLHLDDGQLRINAPRGTLNGELTERIKAQKPAIVALLQGGADPARRPSATAALPADALLPDTIRPSSSAAPPLAAASVILLSGATGFVGAFLLRELLVQTNARLHCLVRADNTPDGLRRLHETLATYQLWRDDFAARLNPVVGDLALPGLGLDPATWQALADTVDTVFHNGAHVHHMLPYERLKAPNVQGTLEMLRLACTGRAKAFHHLSSLSVLPPLQLAQRARFLEDDPLQQFPEPAGGYNRSKWIAELLVAEARARGLATAIYRPGPVAGDSDSGAFNTNDFLYRLMQGYLQLGRAPVGEMPLDLLPVDYLARAVVHLALQDAARGRTFHLLHPRPASSDLLFDACTAAGYRLERVSYADWHRELTRIAREEQHHALYPLVPLFSSRQGRADDTAPAPARAALPYDTVQATSLLRDASFPVPPLDAALFARYLAAMQRTGALAPAIVAT